MSEIKITLTDEEIEQCRQVGIMRYNYARQVGAKDLRVNMNWNEKMENEHEAVMAELAFAKLTFSDTTPIFEVELKPSAWGMDLGDIYLDDYDVWVDVKWSKYKNGRLSTNVKKINGSAHLIVLMTGKMGTYTYRGGMTHKKFFVDAHKYKLSEKSTLSYNADQKDLTYSLKALVNEVLEERESNNGTFA